MRKDSFVGHPHQDCKRDKFNPKIMSNFMLSSLEDHTDSTTKEKSTLPRQKKNRIEETP